MEGDVSGYLRTLLRADLAGSWTGGLLLLESPRPFLPGGAAESVLNLASWSICSYKRMAFWSLS